MTGENKGVIQPVFRVFVMMFSILGLSLVFSSAIYYLLPHLIAEKFPWLTSYFIGVPIFIISIIYIWKISEGKFREYGFNLQKKDLKLVQAVSWGVFFALLMALVDFLPLIVNGSFELGYEISTFSFLGRMSYIWFFVGVFEETLFRGLIQTVLTNEVKGNLNVFGRNLSLGTLIASIFYGLSHSINFLSKPASFVVFQILYTTVFGLLLGHIYQETKSLAGPILMHNVADGIEGLIEHALYLIFL